MKVTCPPTLLHCGGRVPRQRLFFDVFSAAKRNLQDLIRICQDLRGLLAIHFVLLAVTVIFASGDVRGCSVPSGLSCLRPSRLVAVALVDRSSQRFGKTVLPRANHEFSDSFLVGFDSLGSWVRVSRILHWLRIGVDLGGDHPGRTAARFRWFSQHSHRRERMDSLAVGHRVYRHCLSFAAIQRYQPIHFATARCRLHTVTRTYAIGMSGMGIDDAMPRWNANHWQLWAPLMAVASNLPVRDVLFRLASIPLSLAAIVCLFHSLRSLCGRRVPLWAVVLAVFGPVVLWYRAYNAFTYSFRITNSFCLDKDFCLFFLIPAVLYLVAGWLRGAKHFLPAILLSIPAILRFHPMTAVYLVLLTPPMLIGFGPTRSALSKPHGIVRSIQTRVTAPRSQIVALSALSLLVAVVLIGDAQSFHQQIQEVIRIDFDQSLTGRPLHYWIGHYASIPELGVLLDTSTWTGDRFHLRFAIISDSGLFLVAHLGWLIWGVTLWQTQRPVELRRWIAVGIALATLWTVILASPIVLGRYPYLLAGFERLHWFAFVPALMASCFGFKTIADWIVALFGRVEGGTTVTNAARFALVINFSIAAGLLHSAFCLATLRPTGLAAIRGLNSRLDHELIDYQKRLEIDSVSRQTSSLLPSKPPFLRDEDRVLYLGRTGDDKFWLSKQSVFWSEPYAEAFALHRFGDTFRRDRDYFYSLVDHIVDQDSLQRWLEEKRVTLMVDRSDGGDSFLDQLDQQHRLGMQRIEPGVWRITW